MCLRGCGEGERGEFASAGFFYHNGKTFFD